MMTEPRFRSEYQRTLWQSMVDGKAFRDANGSVNAHLDAMYDAIVVRGEFPDGSQVETPDAGKVAKPADGTVRRPEAGARAGNQYGPAVVKFASDAQLRFMRHLVKARDLSAASGFGADLLSSAVPQIEAGKVNRKHASDILDVLTSLPELPKPAAAAGAPAKPARRANRFGAKCVECGQWVAAEAGYLAKTAAGKWAAEHVACPAKSAPVEPAREWTFEDSGIYRDPQSGLIFKVYQNQAKTRMLAKQLVIKQVSLVRGEPSTWEFSYRGMAERFVQFGWRMSLEQAKAFGAIYGVCCNCGATLTDEGSIAAGIGPVCARKF